MKKVFLIILSSMILAGCQNAAIENTSEDPVITNAPESQTISSVNTQDTIIATQQIGGYDVQLVMIKGQEVTDTISPYHGLLEGQFQFVVKQKKKDISKMLIEFTGSEDMQYFPKEIQLQTSDYNGDGREDFALGQRLGSSAMDYQFYTVTEDGEIKKLSLDAKNSSGAIVAIADGYSPVFRKKNGKIQYKQYDQSSGKYIHKQMQIKREQEELDYREEVEIRLNTLKTSLKDIEKEIERNTDSDLKADLEYRYKKLNSVYKKYNKIIENAKDEFAFKEIAVSLDDDLEAVYEKINN